MGKALGLEIRKVFGVKMTNEQKIELEAANKVKQDLKLEKEEEAVTMIKEEQSSSSSCSSSSMPRQITA